MSCQGKHNPPNSTPWYFNIFSCFGPSSFLPKKFLKNTMLSFKCKEFVLKEAD